MSWGEQYDAKINLAARVETFIFGLGKKKKVEVEQVPVAEGSSGGNPNHIASGPNGGQFTSGDGGGASSLEGKSEEDRWKATKKEFSKALDASGAKLPRGDKGAVDRQVAAIDAAGYKLLNIMDDAKRAEKIKELVADFNGTKYEAPSSKSAPVAEVNSKRVGSGPNSAAGFIESTGRGGAKKAASDHIMTEREFREVTGRGGAKQAASDHPMTAYEFMKATGRGTQGAPNDHPMTEYEFRKYTGRGGQKDASNDHPMTNEEFRKAMGFGK